MNVFTLELQPIIRNGRQPEPLIKIKLYPLTEAVDRSQGTNEFSGEQEIGTKNNYKVSFRADKENPEDSDLIRFQEASVFINDIMIGTISSREIICGEDGAPFELFEGDSKKTLKEFLMDCYGSVQFSVSILYGEGENNDSKPSRLISDYISIKQDHDTQNDIDAMIGYINSYSDDLPLTDQDNEAKRAGALYPFRILNTREDNEDDIWARKAETIPRIKRHKWSTHAQLAKKINKTYEAQYGYFLTHPVTCIKKELQVNTIEHMQIVTPDTLCYIAQHPEYLQPNERYGIPINGRKYLPQKALLMQNVVSRDTYENRSVLGFLRCVVEDLQKDVDEIAEERGCQNVELANNEGEQQNIQEQIDEENGEIAYYLNQRREELQSKANFLRQQIQELDDWEAMIGRALEQIMRQLRMYRIAFNFDMLAIYTKPRKTDIFLSITPYNLIYSCMEQWFNFREYNMDYNGLYLPLTRLSNLYERYFLTLLLRYFDDLFKREHWEYTLNTQTYIYNQPSIQLNYSNWDTYPDDIHNTFTYSLSNGITITLFYQPIIYTMESKNNGISDNGINLHRTSLLSFSSFQNALTIGAADDLTRHMTNINSTIRNSIYCYCWKPDFLIKMEYNNKHKYLILDTKYSSRSIVRTFHVRELFYKYVMSIKEDNNAERNPNNSNDKISFDKDPHQYGQQDNRVYIAYGRHTDPSIEPRNTNPEEHEIDLNIPTSEDESGRLTNDLKRYPYLGIFPIFATKSGAERTNTEEGERNNFNILDKIFKEWVEHIL